MRKWANSGRFQKYTRVVSLCIRSGGARRQQQPQSQPEYFDYDFYAFLEDQTHISRALPPSLQSEGGKEVSSWLCLLKNPAKDILLLSIESLVISSARASPNGGDMGLEAPVHSEEGKRVSCTEQWCMHVAFPYR